MDYTELKKKLVPWKPIYILEHICSQRTRHIFRIILSFLFVTALILGLVEYLDFLPVVGDKLVSLALVFLSLWFILFFLDCFYYSYYFRHSKDIGRFALELALIVFNPPKGDLTKGFISSSVGKEILLRAGISKESQKNFLSTRKSKIPSDNFIFPPDRSAFRSYLKGLWASDPEFKNFILAEHVTEEEFLGAAIWTASVKLDASKLMRWWDKDKLLKVEPIGRNWSYGKAYSLMKYARPFTVVGSVVDEGYHLEEAKLLEIVLSRSQEANALLVGEAGVGKMEVLEELHRLMERGEISPALKDKQIWVFEMSLLSSVKDNAQVFERELLRILAESERAGNIIFVIPNMSAFLEAGNSYGVSVITLLAPFLSSTKMQIVGISSTDEYERRLEPLGDIKKHFEKVIIKPVDEDTLVGILKSEVTHLEQQLGIIISYPAVSEAIVASKRYFIDRPLVDTATDLLVESAAKAKKDGKRTVYKEDIFYVVGSKTGIPTGKVEAKEKDKLLNLEVFLKERIVGQDDAVRVVSDAIRRARSGIGNPLRPTGSFLFLGPTGVGKTETAKALGEVFFGEASKLIRLDMSEYNSSDSLNRLIGSFESNTPGTLVTLLRGNPYGVLLLDEFEKTDSRVLDLFLQVIDEGIFSDMHGEKVSARNVIIVATSNAGSDIIFEYLKSNQNLSAIREPIIDEIIAKGIFKPELLNRFDGVVLFHPLSDADLRQIATHLLRQLADRLKKKGITLKISDSLVNYLVKKGTDPKFGARPLNRAIQETIEQTVAKKMISGEVASGSVVEITDKDLY